MEKMLAQELMGISEGASQDNVNKVVEKVGKSSRVGRVALQPCMQSCFRTKNLLSHGRSCSTTQACPVYVQP